MELSRIYELKIFSDSPRDHLNHLLEGATVKSLRHRQVLYRAGDDVIACAVVVSGALKLVKQTVSGEDVIVFFATPGETVGTLLMSSEKSAYPVTVVAMGPSQVIEVPKRTFNTAWVKDPTIMRKVNGILFARIHDMHEQKAFGKAPLAGKVAKQLVSLIDRFSDDGAGTVLPIPITRQEIADSVGASVESVIRVMSDWSQQGILKTSGQYIEVLRLDRIAEIINGSS